MNIRCTHCGADLPIESHTDFMRCAYCDAALYVETDRTIPHYYAPERIARTDIKGIIERKLAQLEIADHPELQQVELAYFPFWQAPAPATGQPQYEPAVTPWVMDLMTLRCPGGELLFYRNELTENHRVVEPELLLELSRTGELSADDGAASSSTATLVHLPLFDVRYSSGGHSFRAVVEAVSGMIYADDWPPSTTSAKSRALGVVAALALISFTAVSALAPNGWTLLLGLPATAAAVYTLAALRLRNLD